MDIKTFLENKYKSRSLNKIIYKICQAAEQISFSIRNDLYYKNIDHETRNFDGDIQNPLDVFADKAILESLNQSDVAGYCSEEQDEVIQLDKNGKYLVLCDPLDGSSNIRNNVSIGTIFSIMPMQNLSFEMALKQSGINQLCSGFFVYGPQTTLFLTLGNGVHSFIFSELEKKFKILNEKVRILQNTSEFSINSSYRRFWTKKVKSYIETCENGFEGKRKKNFTMRWVGSLVADSSRIFERGGIFLYPEDKREKNKNGRLRLTYEANPIAFLVEQAGGKATDGNIDILKVNVKKIHQRVPFIFGSKEEVDTFLNTE